jgi:hypothetical protein
VQDFITSGGQANLECEGSEPDLTKDSEKAISLQDFDSIRPIRPISKIPIDAIQNSLTDPEEETLASVPTEIRSSLLLDSDFQRQYSIGEWSTARRGVLNLGQVTTDNPYSGGMGTYNQGWFDYSPGLEGIGESFSRSLGVVRKLKLDNGIEGVQRLDTESGSGSCNQTTFGDASSRDEGSLSQEASASDILDQES